VHNSVLANANTSSESRDCNGAFSFVKHACIHIRILPFRQGLSCQLYLFNRFIRALPQGPQAHPSLQSEHDFTAVWKAVVLVAHFCLLSSCRRHTPYIDLPIMQLCIFPSTSSSDGAQI